MAINSNINPYAAGAVVIDNRPYLQFYQQQQAKRQAKEDALDNYFRDLGKNITPSGMRNQDVEGLSKRTNEWRQYYAENKKAITNPSIDNGKAYTEYMSRYQDQLGYIDRSKNRLKTSDELGKLKLDPSKSYILDDPALMDKLHQHDLPLDDPGGKDLNLMEIATPPKPWSIKDQAAHSAYLTHNLDVDKIPGKTVYLGGFKTMTPITHQYSDKTLQTIGQRSGSAYDMDRSLQFETAKISKQLEKDPAAHDQLNTTFKQVYGRDMQGDRDLRIAQDLSNENKKSIEYKQETDEFGRSKALAAIQHGYRLSEAEAKEALKNKSADVQNSVTDKLFDDKMADAMNNPRLIKPVTGEPYYQYEMKPSNADLKMFAVPGDKGHLIYPDAIRRDLKNKTITPIFFETYTDADEKANSSHKSGEIKKNAKGEAPVIKNLSYPILESEYKQKWKKEIMGAGAYGKELSKGTPSSGKETTHPLPAGKPRTVRQGGHTYTWNENTGNYE